MLPARTSWRRRMEAAGVEPRPAHRGYRWPGHQRLRAGAGARAAGPLVSRRRSTMAPRTEWAGRPDTPVEAVAPRRRTDGRSSRSAGNSAREWPLAASCSSSFPFAAAGTFSAVRALRLAPSAGVWQDAVLLGDCRARLRRRGIRSGLVGDAGGVPPTQTGRGAAGRHPEAPVALAAGLGRAGAAGRLPVVTRCWARVIFATLWNLVSLHQAHMSAYGPPSIRRQAGRPRRSHASPTGRHLAAGEGGAGNAPQTETGRGVPLDLSTTVPEHRAHLPGRGRSSPGWTSNRPKAFS